MEGAGAHGNEVEEEVTPVQVCRGREGRGMKVRVKFKVEEEEE